MLQRVAVQSTRVISRRAGMVVATRSYTEERGRATHSKGISDKEKAQEDLFIYEREKARAKQLKEEIAKHQAELDEINKKSAEQGKK